MCLRCLLLCCVLSVIFGAAGSAQEPIRLRFQIISNGSVVANPELVVNRGSIGRIEVKDSVSLAFTPRIDDSRLTLAFDIRTGDKHLRPQLGIDSNNSGVISWTSASGESIRITIVPIR